MKKNPRQKRIVIALNPYLNKPVGIRQTNPGNLPVPGGYPPQLPGYPGNPTSYPGGPTAQMPEGLNTPYFPGQPAVPAKSSTGLLGNFNMEQVKQFIDRMGGIEGIVNTLTRVQKLVQSVQQITPMLKLLLPKAGATTAAEEEEEWDDISPRRRRPRSRKRSYGPRPATGGRRRRPRPYGNYGPRPGSRRRNAGRR
jgi:hypothetical protein